MSPDRILFETFELDSTKRVPAPREGQVTKLHDRYGFLRVERVDEDIFFHLNDQRVVTGTNGNFRWTKGVLQSPNLGDIVILDGITFTEDGLRTKWWTIKTYYEENAIYAPIPVFRLVQAETDQLLWSGNQRNEELQGVLMAETIRQNLLSIRAPLRLERQRAQGWHTCSWEAFLKTS